MRLRPLADSTVLIPRRQHLRFWHRLLHDRTSEAIAKALARVPHANVTIVPFQLGSELEHSDQKEKEHAHA